MRHFLYALVFVSLLIAALGVWEFHSYTPSIMRKRASVRAVASLEQIELGGDMQWVLLRGRDTNASIVLFLHGGPGMPMMYLAHAFQRPIEDDFLTVQWDRRGAGKSYSANTNVEKMRTSQEVADTVELIQKLRTRFGAKKIILVGHSYGSELGVLVAERRPDLIRAYVGVGQVACDEATEKKLQDEWIADMARNRGDAQMLAFATSGKPYDRESALFKYGGEIVKAESLFYLLDIGLRAPEYSLLDAYHVKTGVNFTHAHMKNDVFDGPVRDFVTQLKVPVYFFEGRHDETAPASCAVEYFEKLMAPQKKLVWFEHSAHFPFLEEPAKFHEELVLVTSETTIDAP
jgi:pimeloyl-ACP methyl ester carboxylesterase